jgi:putative FmdB family regulatory protein
MPIYEYVCEKCGSRTEAIQKVSDPPLKKCKKCRGKLEKIFSRTSFQLKGSGWYVSDYSNKPTTSAGNTEKGTEKKTEKKSEGVSSSEGSSGVKSTPGGSE